ncbi:sugar transferase [Chthonobacter albigriseus]|uniref:sugar transferase n=1 Tax=Chthonobacter albigriseus TaxID=1683161 RepID=UPI0015EEA6F8|nr:sugar transferase [Chthonobacter albigriseus]
MRIDTNEELLVASGAVGSLKDLHDHSTVGALKRVYQSAASGVVPQPRRRGFGGQSRRPIGVPPGVSKRAFDFAAALIGLVALLPLLLLIAATIKLTSRGPVFFRQKRIGYQNQLFEIYKFRTMYLERCDASGVAQTTDSDPRVTPFGRFLRRLSLDELPQLLNVVKGDMSLVGPRPHVPGMLAAGVLYEELVPDYFDRHTVRPGLTGLAQVNGFRGPTTNRDMAIGRIEKDLEYVRNAGLLKDIKIIAITLVRELKGGSGH